MGVMGADLLLFSALPPSIQKSKQSQENPVSGADLNGIEGKKPVSAKNRAKKRHGKFMLNPKE
jgi:hypothetical protein